MKAWLKTDQVEYLQQDLIAHRILNDLRPYEVWQVDLPAGGPGKTIEDVRRLSTVGSPNGAVKGLFALRRRLGVLLGWDRVPVKRTLMFEARLSDSDRSASSIPCGTKDGPFTLLYQTANESMSEIVNRTVHAALVWVLIPKPEGYRLLWAIYVKPTGALTALYMALIKPFRHWIVYPSLLKQIHKSWCDTYHSD